MLLGANRRTNRAEESFNMMNNPLEKDQSLVYVGRLGLMSGEL